MNIKDLAEKWIKAELDAFQNGKFELLKEIEDPDVVYHLYPMPDMVGHEAHKQNVMVTFEGQYATEIKQEFEYLTGEGNLCALTYKAVYVSAGKMPNWPPAGEEATNNSLFVLRWKNDRVVEVWSNGHITGINLEAD
jgi:hypothetical protein